MYVSRKSHGVGSCGIPPLRNVRARMVAPGVFPRGLQVAQPGPVAMAGAEFHKPAGREIENGDDENPHGVNERETVAVAERSLGEVGDYGAVEDGLMERQGGQPGYGVNQIEMQYVEKEGHAAKY